MDHKKIFIIAGEPSADIHAAALVMELKKSQPNLKIIGIGSKKMQEAGVEIFADLSQYAVIGFIEVLKHYPIFKKIFNLTLDKIRQENPRAIVLIDYPGFNLRLAKKIRQKFPQVKIIYYISPQVWAWGQKRIELIKKIVDKMIVVFDFEKTLYLKHGVNAEFVGHPLLEIINPQADKTEIMKKHNLVSEYEYLGILPGSRIMEVKRILPVMLKAAKKLSFNNPHLIFLLFKAANIPDDLVEKLLSNYQHLNLKIIKKNRHEILSICSFAWVCSGTATLETAILNTPMLIVYKTSFLTWAISKCLIKLPYIGLVNIVVGEKIVPEFVQYQATAENICNFTQNWFRQDQKDKQILKQKLSTVKQKLGSLNANKNTAQIITNLIITE
ncbi:MAG: lipid-A-disaccharide synthase [Candidatus Omnitrophota bacterium]